MNQEILRQEKEGALIEKEKSHFKIGKAVDINLTGLPAEFADTFHISKLTKLPGEKGIAVLKQAFNLVTQLNPGKIRGLEVYTNQLETATDVVEYRQNWGFDKRLDALKRENGEAYWQDMIDGVGKMILSGDEVEKAKVASKNLREHPNTSRFFATDHPEHIDIVFQFPCYWLYEETEGEEGTGIRCKALLDEVYIDHSNEAIYPLDVKTTGDHVLLFNRAIKKRRYDIQGAMYTEGLIKNLERLSALIRRDVTSYTIKNFGFLVESTVSPGTPMAFVLDDNMMALGKNGDSKWYHGWVQGVQIYEEWRKNDFSITNRFPNGMIVVTKDFQYTENF